MLKTALGDVRFREPTIYQPATDRHSRTAIEGRCRLGPHNRVTFHVGRYDPRRPLVIDPAVAYSTYLGGSNADIPYGNAVDASGSAYVAGFTESTNFPTTPGAFQSQCPPGCASGGVAFVSKLNPAGSAMVYATYLGGSTLSQSNAVAVDFSGDAYVTGYTDSLDFPVTPGAFQGSCAAGNGYCANPYAFVTELNPAGSALLYSTYLGGSQPTSLGLPNFGYGIAVDSMGAAYVTGYTGAIDFPTTPGAFQTSNCSDCGSAFITKFSAGGSAAYSTYLNGVTSGITSANAIAVDAAGNVYVTGSTDNIPTTPGAFQVSRPASAPQSQYNAFVTDRGFFSLRPALLRKRACVRTAS